MVERTNNVLRGVVAEDETPQFTVGSFLKLLDNDFRQVSSRRGLQAAVFERLRNTLDQWHAAIPGQREILETEAAVIIRICLSLCAKK